MYQFEFRTYQRQFKRPLQTSHGIWNIREGIILRLTNQNGQIGWGEIAPLSWFGSESLEQASDFCRQLPANISEETIFSISSELPACQFGFESALSNSLNSFPGSAWECFFGGSAARRMEAEPPDLRSQAEPGNEESNSSNSFPGSAWECFPGGSAACTMEAEPPDLRFQAEPGNEDKSPDLRYHAEPGNEDNINRYSGLLPAGETALQALQMLWKQGYRTFKWKIGVVAIDEELKIFDRLITAMHKLADRSQIFLRLDANGGLSYLQAQTWLQACDNLKTISDFFVNIEFLEQPLPVSMFEEMLELNALYATAIALDESAANLERMQECERQGWRGIFVIKPAIAGSPSQLQKFCQTHKIDAVFSSVFETQIGRQAALNLAERISPNSRALGFGTDCWF
jgi:o-succinylbenzoate synthase